jgi:hypothetical protein
LTVVDDGPGFLEPWQWAELDEVLFEASVRPSSFEQGAVLTRQGWIFTSRLPTHDQYATLRHSEYGSDVFVEIRWGTDGSDEDGAYTLAMKPRPDARPRTVGPQLASDLDWDDLVDVVAEWADVAAKDLRARGLYQDVRERARADWAPFVQREGRMRELTSETFIGEDLPKLLEKALDDAGVHDERVRRRMREWADGRRAELLWLVQQRSQESAREFGRLVFDALRRDLATAVARIVRDGFVEGVMSIWRLW